MNKNLIIDGLRKLISEEAVSGEKVTKRAQSVSKKQNNASYKATEKAMKDYDGKLKNEADDAIEPKKNNIEGEQKEYHDDMEIMNGQEMIQYDLEPSKQFKDRAKKALTGDSSMGNKVYTGEENGNTESVWGASDDDFGKKLVDRANRSKKKRNDATQTITQFGDDIEMSDGDPKIKSKKIATESVKKESMKRIKFKSKFDGVGNALKLIPESFKVDNKEFEMTDGVERYRMKWRGSLTEGKAEILQASSKDLMNETFSKIKHLMGYKSETTLGTLSGKERVNENEIMKKGLK